MSAGGRALVVVGLLARVASADEQASEGARIHVRAGTEYFTEGRFEDALHEMEAARRLYPVPALEYNVAQCLERLGRYEDAMAAYRRYLDGTAAPGDREEVDANIRYLERRAREARDAAAAKPPEPIIKKEVVFKTVIVYRTAPPKPGRGARWAALGVAALGVAALVATIATLVLGQRESDRVTNGANPVRPTVFDGPLRQAEANADTLLIISYVSFGVAGLAGAGALGLFFFGRKIDRDAPKLTFAPAGPAGTPGFSLAVRF
jgi:hypothetical protein